jgi:GAF domain-containing protein
MVRVRRYQEILTDFGRMAPDTSDISRLLQLACVQAARHRHHSFQDPALPPRGGDLLIVAGAGWKPGVVGQASLESNLASPPGHALQTRQSVVIDDVPNDPEFRYAPVLRDHGIVSALNTPISVDGSVRGVLEVDSETPRYFGPDDTRVLSGLANILGLALHGRFGLTRAAEAAADATLALARDRTLLAELRHCSKNDLQLVLSMLVLQKRKQEDEQARRGFDHLLNRLPAISIAHDQLASSGEAGKVELAEYLRSLCGNLAQRRKNIEIVADLVPVELPHGGRPACSDC